MCLDEQKHAIFKDINLRIHKKNCENYCFLLQCGELPIEIGAKVHLDTLGIYGGPRGAPKIAKK